MRTKLPVLGLIAFCLVASAVGVGYGHSAYRSKAARHIGEQMRMVASTVNASAVYLVNGEEVTLQEIMDRKALLEGNALAMGKQPETVTMQDALNVMIRTRVQVAEAKRLGITVSKEEITTITAEQRETSKHLSPEARQLFEAELAGRQLTEEEFWAQEEPRYETALYVIKLRQYITKDIVDPDQKMVAYEAFVEDLVAQADVRALENVLDN